MSGCATSLPLTRPADEELAADRRQQAAWLDELRRVGLLSGDLDEVGVDQVVSALYKYLGRTRSGSWRSRWPTP